MGNYGKIKKKKKKERNLVCFNYTVTGRLEKVSLEAGISSWNSCGCL